MTYLLVALFTAIGIGVVALSIVVLSAIITNVICNEDK